MHGSEGGNESALISNLLRLDCIQCHAQDPLGGSTSAVWTGLSASSEIPQVAYLDTDLVDGLAGGNFSLANADDGKAHNVNDLFGDDFLIGTGTFEANVSDAPPGNSGAAATNHAVFTVTDKFDAFTCAGARGCHGTRAQGMEDDNNGTTDGFQGVLRTGMLAINGSHHANAEGAKDSAQNLAGVHNGATVAAGYRFIPGLKGFGNPTDRWENVDENSHNEYYGDATAINIAGCTTCHISDTSSSDRIGTDSTLKVPNNSMSGFCSTCHGNFHSSGTNNGSSGAFLRHPSDFVIPEGTTEYAAYNTWVVSAPVARPALASAVDADVNGGTDLVMCLSCHVAHGSDQQYLLRFDYSTMIAGSGGTAGVGCLACHTEKD
jgi:hypothetical protein